MCLIVDANVAAKTFANPPHVDFAPVYVALTDGNAMMVHGGRLTQEYERIGSIRGVLLELDRAGRTQIIKREEVDAAEELLRLARVCSSDDAHIIALAQVSGARLLCSHDQDLHGDFTNKDLVAKPRGSVYQNARHAHLLRKVCKTTR